MEAVRQNMRDWRKLFKNLSQLPVADFRWGDGISALPGAYILAVDAAQPTSWAESMQLQTRERKRERERDG